MVFDTKAGVWKNVKNEPLSMPLTKEAADEKALVSEIPDDWTFQAITDIESNGNPHVSVKVGPDIGARRSGSKRIQHYRWDGHNWSQSNTTTLPKGDGDLEVKSAEEVSLYIESKTNDEIGEVSRWDSSDGGSSFQKGQTFLQREDAGFVISALIDNPHPDARFIVAEKRERTYYRKMYLLGDSGSIQRKKKDADVLKE
jgi:hypothetical protein